MAEADEEADTVPRRAGAIEQGSHLVPFHLVADHLGVTGLHRLHVALDDAHQDDENRERPGVRELRGEPLLEIVLQNSTTGVGGM